MDDGMKRVSRERLEPALKLHKNMNYNMIRNWTGESTEEVFYELCDEYGMLVMNDFWLSTDGFNLNPLDNCLFVRNVTETVRRFRNHPSIALWCARNEGFATNELEYMLAARMAAGMIQESPVHWRVQEAGLGVISLMQAGTTVL